MCKLDHTLHTKPSTESGTKMTPSRAIPKGDNLMPTTTTHHQGPQRSPLKKPHVQESTENGSSLSEEVVIDVPVSLKTSGRAAIRSFSSPASAVHRGTKPDARNGIEQSGESHSSDDSSKPLSAGKRHRETKPDIQNRMEKSTDSHSCDDHDKLSLTEERVSSDNSNLLVEFQHFDKDMIRTLPKSFDFSSQLSTSSASEEFHTPEGISPSHDDKENVFVFSASSPVLQGKRRNAATAVTPPLLEVAGEGEGSDSEATSREVAMLTQQLELGSDDVSGLYTEHVYNLE